MPERPEEVAEEDDPYTPYKEMLERTVPVPPRPGSDSVQSAGLYADALRRGAGIEIPRSAQPGPGRQSALTPEELRRHYHQGRTDELLRGVESLSDPVLGLPEQGQSTGFRPGTQSHIAALRQRVGPDELREAMKERIEEIAADPGTEIPTMAEIREGVQRELEEEKRLSPSERLQPPWGLQVPTIPDDPFDPPVMKYGTPVPVGPHGIPFLNKSAEILHNLLNPDDPVLFYDPERRQRRIERHEASQRALSRAKESPGYETAFPIHVASLQEKLRRGEFPDIPADALEDAIRGTLKRFTAERGPFGFGSPTAPIEQPTRALGAEVDPWAAHAEIVRGDFEPRKPTSEGWAESIRDLYTSIRGEEEGLERGEKAGMDWTEELAFLDALSQIIAQKRSIEGTPTSQDQGEALLRSIERAMKQREAEAARREFGGQ